jgi:pimeloyl-ACP methyl ester carboxylesterase
LSWFVTCSGFPKGTAVRFILPILISLFVLVPVSATAQGAEAGADPWIEYLPAAGSPASLEGFWRGIISREGSAQILELDFTSTEDGWTVRCRVPDWFGWPWFDLEPPAFEDGILRMKLIYGLDCLFELDPVYGELHGVAQGSSTPFTAHFKRALAPPEPPLRRVPVEVEHGEGDDAVLVRGTLILPDDPGPHPVMIHVHGRGKGSRGNDVYVHRAEVIAGYGIGGLVYDKRGCGESTGDHDAANVVDHGVDVMEIMAVLAERDDVDPGRIGLMGVSAGAWSSSVVVGRSRIRPAFLVTSVGPFESVFDQQWHVTEAFMTREGFTRDQIDAAIAYTKLECGTDESPETVEAMRQGLQDAEEQGWDSILDEPPTTREELRRSWARINRYDPAEDLARMDMPVLAFFGEDDFVVAPEYNIPALETIAKRNGNDDVTPVVLRAMGHGLESPLQLQTFPDDPRAGRYYFHWNRLPAGYGETLIEWLRERLDLAEEEK